MFNYTKPNCNVKCSVSKETESFVRGQACELPKLNDKLSEFAGVYNFVDNNLCTESDDYNKSDAHNKLSFMQVIFCTTHCTEKNHGHCIHGNCDSSENTCFESSLCSKHCDSPGHSHCRHKNCDSSTNICDSNSFCSKSHCSDLSHSHCVFSKCESTTNICEVTGKCPKHAF